MLRRIRNFLDQHLILGPAADSRDSEHRLRLAVGALLLE